MKLSKSLDPQSLLLRIANSVAEQTAEQRPEYKSPNFLDSLVLARCVRRRPVKLVRSHLSQAFRFATLPQT